MAEINWTQEAQSWLKDIYDYIAADNPEAAAQNRRAFHSQESEARSTAYRRAVYRTFLPGTPNAVLYRIHRYELIRVRA